MFLISDKNIFLNVCLILTSMYFTTASVSRVKVVRRETNFVTLRERADLSLVLHLDTQTRRGSGGINSWKFGKFYCQIVHIWRDIRAIIRTNQCDRQKHEANIVGNIHYHMLPPKLLGIIGRTRHSHPHFRRLWLQQCSCLAVYIRNIELCKTELNWTFNHTCGENSWIAEYKITQT